MNWLGSEEYPCADRMHGSRPLGVFCISWTENAVCPVSQRIILTAMIITGRTSNRWRLSGWMWLIMPLK